VILDSYTVYLDLWIANREGRILANGRPGQYTGVKGGSVASEDWFRNALKTRDGSEFVACDISQNESLNGSKVATFATAIRDHGSNNGAPLGVLGIFFDWDKQAQAVLDGVRLTDEERSRTRCLIVDAQHRIIAASDVAGIFSKYPIRTEGNRIGSYVDAEGNLIGFALTPGYETYQGLGWSGIVIQGQAGTNAQPRAGRPANSRAS
jgi:hypothetical protein